jgi:GTP pyrophosphokinase
MQVVQAKYGFKEWEGILSTVGHGGLKEGQVINRLLEEYTKDHKEEITDETIIERVKEATKRTAQVARSKSGIVVKGIDDMAVRFSRCCSPVPGDEIVGFVTRGRGMSIHRTDCVNIINLSETERIRLINAEWEASVVEERGQYMASIKIFANNRQGLLMEVSKVFTENKLDISSINTHTSKQDVASLDLSFVVTGRDQLTHVIEKLRQIPGVLDIERTTG